MLLNDLCLVRFSHRLPRSKISRSIREQPDLQNAAVRYKETDILPCFVMRLARNAFQKEGMLVAFGVFGCLNDEQLTTCLRNSTAQRSA
jgi:hypothetical protein